MQAITLPSAREWRVKDNDVVVRGHIPCITRTKGFLFDKVTDLKPRFLTLTNTGLLIIYNNDDKGHVVNVKDAKIMTTRTDHFRRNKQAYRRCVTKLKFKHGSVSLILFNNCIPAWRNAIIKAHDGLLNGQLRFTGTHRKSPTPIPPVENPIIKDIEVAQAEQQPPTSKSPSCQDSAASIITCVDAECVIPAEEASSEVTVDMPEDNEPITVVEAPRIKVPAAKRLPSVVASSNDDSQMGTFDPTVCDLSYQWLHKKTKQSMKHARKCNTVSSNSGLFTETTEDDVSRKESVKSVRCGYTSVATLRKRLEAKIYAKEIRDEKKPTHIRNFALERTKISNGNPAQTERIPTRKTALMASNILPPRPKIRRLRHLGRSRSESNIANMETRRLNEVQAMRSCDDSLLARSEKHNFTKSPPQDWRTSGVRLDKYYSNQWWAQPLTA
ncbi:unnamed protein product [Angiostrongylus costaricensis]|uniref:WH1 domain-containing protein n=1 Tax=Angiostrongylus costaricensis TaxID=334426 RepID=A0A158PE23_ANGCS|nr:unnamed protein product [Angiostrongylus costaricensis]